MPAEQEPRYIEAEGDKPKVERTRHYFAAIYAGLKTAEEYGRELTLENERLEAELQAAQEALERIASNEAFGTAGTLGQGWAENECRQRMRVAREALAAQRTEEPSDGAT